MDGESSFESICKRAVESMGNADTRTSTMDADNHFRSNVSTDAETDPVDAVAIHSFTF